VLGRGSTARTAALSEAVLPDAAVAIAMRILVARCKVAVAAIIVAVVVRRATCIGVSRGILGALRVPLVGTSASRCGGHIVFRRAVTRVGRRQRSSIPRVVCPRVLTRTITLRLLLLLLGLQCLISLILGNLVIDVTRVR
jgi:hypothetical protein